MNYPKDTYKRILNDLGRVSDMLLEVGKSVSDDCYQGVFDVSQELLSVMSYIEDEYYACDKSISCGVPVGKDQDGFMTAYAKSSECSNEDIRALSRFPGRVCYI